MVGWNVVATQLVADRIHHKISVLTSTSDQFFHGKTWQYPRKSMDISTSKCFFFRGNYSVAIEMTPNLRCKSDNVLYFVRCLSRLYIHAWSSLYPRLAVVVSTLCIRFFFKCKPRNKTSLQPRLAISVSTAGRRRIHALYKFFFLNANPRNSDGDAIPTTGML